MLFSLTFYSLKGTYYAKFTFNSCLDINVTLDHKTSLKSLGYICSNSQKYIVWVKIIDFSIDISFMPKMIRILSKDHVSWRYFVNFLL